MVTKGSLTTDPLAAISVSRISVLVDSTFVSGWTSVHYISYGFRAIRLWDRPTIYFICLV